MKTAACFVAGTMVATRNGFRAIEDIKQGDIVLSSDEDTVDVYNLKVEEFHTYFVGKCEVLVHNRGYDALNRKTRQSKMERNS